MAMQDKSGNWHHSASRARLHDEMAESKGKSSGVVQKKDSADAGGKSHTPGPTETPIEDHVQEHGPAHAVNYRHDEATGKHVVTSFHGDAEPKDGMGGGESAEGSEHTHPGVHISHHKTHHAAMQHMQHAMGAHDESEETPDEADEEPAMAPSGSAGGIPGLS
jgi:hypothetical protein